MNELLRTCQVCKASCCRIGGTDFLEEEKKSVLEAGFEDHFVKIEEDHYETRCKDGVCPYLDEDDSCKIHNLRPKLCRRWPVYSDAQSGVKQHFFVNCPISHLLSATHMEDMCRIAKEVTHVFISDSTEKTTLDDSTLSKVSERFSKFEKTPIFI